MEPFIFETSRELEAINTYDAREQNTGVGARRAIKMLGCAACDLGQVNLCTVKTDLESRAEAAETNAEAFNQLDMLASAPSWLNAARINLSGMSSEALAAQVEDDESAKAFVASGGLQEFFADTTNSFEGVFNKKDLPELQGMAAIDEQTPLTGTRIETKNGDTFTVIDASSAVGYTGPSIDATSYGVLTGKMLNRMQERDPRGNPQILNEDFKMQKTLASRLPNAPITEFRMTGKNRLYATITPDAGETTARIVILGSHGGDAKTQNDFIDYVTRQS
jgi:hypothetical protein